MSDVFASAAPPAVSVVVPVRNEAGNVAPLVAEIAAALGEIRNFEVDLRQRRLDRPHRSRVDAADGEPSMAAADQAWDLVRAIGGGGERRAARARERHRHPRRRWPERPAFIPALLAALAAGAPRIGLVAGQRVGRKATGFKKFQSRLANAVRNAVLRDGTRDTGCGLKAFRRDVFMALPYFDGLHRFLPALVRRDGYDIGYVDVIDRPRHAGRSNYGMWDRLWVGILDLLGVWWLIRRRRHVPCALEVKRDAD